MNHNLDDLNDYLFLALESVTNDDLTDEQLLREINRSAAVVRVAEAVIRTGALALRAREAAEDYGLARGNKRQGLPKMLEVE